MLVSLDEVEVVSATLIVPETTATPFVPVANFQVAGATYFLDHKRGIAYIHDARKSLERSRCFATSAFRYCHSLSQHAELKESNDSGCSFDLLRTE